jgi:hypothetical protein
MNIEEIRQQYPQYQDMSDEQLASALHQKFYSDMPYADFASKVGVQVKRDQPEQPKERSLPESLLRQVGLTARGAISGVAALPNMIADPLYSLANKFGANLSIPSQGLERTLTRAGFPEPENGTERFSNAVVGGMVQPAMLGKAIPAMAARMGTQTAAAAAGAGSSNLAEQTGFGPTGQIIAGLAGGVGIPTAAAFTKAGGTAAGRLAGGLVAPLTKEGRNDIAARILQQSASDPQAAASNIATAPRYVPGVNPLTAELANDPGISSLSKNLRNQNPAAFAGVDEANDAARQAALAKSFGNATDLQMAQQARDDVTTPMRNAAFADAKKVDTRPIVNTATTITKSGAGGRQEVERAMAWVKDRLKGETDPERIYAIRQDINDIIAGKMRDPEKASFQLAAGQLNAVKAVLDNQLEKSAPGFKNYLSQYADRSRTIDALGTGQDIIGKSINPTTERLSPASFARQMANRGEDVANMGAIGSDVMSRMNADLKRSVAPAASMRTAGSDTLQNMVGNDMLQKALGHVPGGVTTRIASKLASVVYSPFEQQTRALLAQSMVNPELAAGLLGRELKKRPDLIRGLLDKWPGIYSGAVLGTGSAQ